MAVGMINGTSAFGGEFNRSMQHLLSCQMRRVAYGGDGAGLVHTEAEG
jgi:hypothetical protein